jgi:hypothetical protein
MVPASTAAPLEVVASDDRPRRSVAGYCRPSRQWMNNCESPGVTGPSCAVVAKCRQPSRPQQQRAFLPSAAVPESFQELLAVLLLSREGRGADY